MDLKIYEFWTHQSPLHRVPDNSAKVNGRGVETTKTERVNAALKIQGKPIIAMKLRGRATKQPRIRGRMTTLSRQGSHCHPLNSSQLFNRLKDSSGLGLRGEIWRGETSLNFTSIIRTSGIGPTIVIGSGGY